MPEENPYLQNILDKLDEVKADWQELFKGSFSIGEVLELLKSLIEAAEAVITAPKSGADKHKLVKDAFNHLDRRFNLIDKIDDAIPLPFFLEPFDGPAIRAAIDLLISAMVTVFNSTIWKD